MFNIISVTELYIGNNKTVLFSWKFSTAGNYILQLSWNHDDQLDFQYQ